MGRRPVQSVFHPTEVFFSPYTKAEIREILADRVRQGLYPGMMPAPLLYRIAGIAADERDIRVGLDLIGVAVMQAGRRRGCGGRSPDGHRAVTPDPDSRALTGRAHTPLPDRGAVPGEGRYDFRGGL